MTDLEKSNIDTYLGIWIHTSGPRNSPPRYSVAFSMWTQGVVVMVGPTHRVYTLDNLIKTGVSHTTIYKYTPFDYYTKAD